MEEKYESAINLRKRKTVMPVESDMLNTLTDIKKERFIHNLANELDIQTAPFDHVFISQKKAKPEVKDELMSVTSGQNYRFYCKIPKPPLNYSIRFNKYSDFPSKIPKYKDNHQKYI